MVRRFLMAGFYCYGYVYVYSCVIKTYSPAFFLFIEKRPKQRCLELI